jgi:metallo-beta-lactamase class B
MKILLLSLFLIFIPSFSDAQPAETIHISRVVELIRLNDHAYIHVSCSTIPGFGRVASNGLIFINKGKAFLFDTPTSDSLTEVLVRYLEDSMKLKITGFVPNHWHSDCMGGLGYLQARHIKSYANRLTVEQAKIQGLPVPDQAFDDSLHLNLDRKDILCFYPGPAHSTDNIAVWIPSEKILFAGCMVKSMDSKNLGNTADGDPQEYPETIKRLKARFPEAKIVIPGHGAYGGPELITHTLELTGNLK